MTAYNPLSWPPTQPRTQFPTRSQFDTSLSHAIFDLYDQLRKMGATDVQVTSNAKIGRSGTILSEQSKLQDTGVAVYFVRKGQELCFACDKWDRLQDNIRAIGKSIEALRGLERWGSQQMVDAAFLGFAALPAGSHWWEVLEVGPRASRDEIQLAFKRLVKQCHPDRGGDPEIFHRLKQAYDQGMAV